MNDALLQRIAGEFGTPCFVYDYDAVRARAAALRDAFGGRFRVSYAMKCNPNAALLGRLRADVELLDVSSGGELERAVGAGWSPAHVTFTGPAKRDAELRAAVRHGVGGVVLESVAEAVRLDGIAAAAGVSAAPVLVRIAPARVPAGFGSRMSGKASQFGIDEEDVPAAIPAIQRLRHLSVTGLHLYAGTQCLNVDALAEYYGITADLFARTCRGCGIRPGKLIFGSGLGIPYYDGDRAVDIAALAARTSPALDELAGELGHPQLALETGRYLVGEAGVYLTRVVSAKRSRGTEFRLCDGGMNHHLGAAGHLGTVIHRNYRMRKVGASPDEPRHAYNVCGPLCTAIDTLANAVGLPTLDVGDVIAIECSGAYGPTASPVHFIGHPGPREVLVEGGRLTDVTELG